MSTPEAAAPQPQQDPAQPVSPEPLTPEATEPEVVDAEVEPEAVEPVVTEASREVTLQRSVRYGRVLVGTAALGAIIAMLLVLVFPVAEKADYTLGQAVGFMAVIGAAIGLGIGALLSLVLGVIARRSRGSGVAIQSDVR
ncbi:hypothetical protein [Leucobacter chromiireducens]|uniref:MFS transporter n=1 Tax=Leucobacter chromiireducens subsp. chromiireducens TaxID=660067 RepID=A0ABS1SNS5_9MICO|nr:hypothetical protein [Leucobacter chromiireducens]MBL3688787.1 hypothetical protein [Leucobacter chromiireducens subsp. chromiireducens]